MSLPYSSLALCYDRLNSDIDYKGWADRLALLLEKHGVERGDLVLDLACGTGNLTLPLAERGFDMIGIDLSPEMLDMARSKQARHDILWLCQDMRSFELYGTVKAVICCLDSINYLTSKSALDSCFSLVHNYLDPNGIFIFDVNSPYKFENIYGSNHYILEGDGVYCGWRNSYSKRSGICSFELSIFAEEPNGTWRRFDELQKEKCHSVKTLTSCLKKAGFEVLSVTADLEGNKPSVDTERIFFFAKAIK